jgi:tetratricopeptide (TPR) repeat protein
MTVEPPKLRSPTEAPAPTREPRLSAVELDRLLTTMEEVLLKKTVNHALAYAYRKRCMDSGRYDRSIEFFQELVAKEPDNTWARLELSVAYIDKIPSRGGIAAVVSKGILARKSLDQLDRILAEQEASWLVHYARGMNHLHWPRALRHQDNAVADFRRCLELQRAEEGANGPGYYVRPYILLGDALAKDGSDNEARQAWRDGLRIFPGSPELRERLEIDKNEALLEFVLERRSLEAPIDTDFSFIDRHRKANSPDRE